MKDTPFCIKKTLNIGGILLNADRPKIVGILNVTPDSFYSGSRLGNSFEVLNRAGQMLSEGADILDIGGYSSRPGAEPVSEQEELDRVLPAIEKILRHHPDAILSIDTFRSRVARKALQEGVRIVNDISGGQMDEKMIETIAEYRAPFVLMHMRGDPGTMASLTDYKNPVREIFDFFSARIEMLRMGGVADIILDPGFGFAKTMDQNYEILKSIGYFTYLGLPLMVGISRKSMIYKKLGISPELSLNGTTVLNTWALLKQASFLRVHDCKEAKEAITLVQKIVD